MVVKDEAIRFNPGINLIADIAIKDITGIIVSFGLPKNVKKTATAATEDKAATSKKILGETLTI